MTEQSCYLLKARYGDLRFPSLLPYTGCYTFAIYILHPSLSALQLATVIDQDRVKAEAVIQLNLSKEVMNADFDDICEYLVEDEDDYI